MRDYDFRGERGERSGGSEMDQPTTDPRMRALMHRRMLQRKAKREEVTPNAGDAVERAGKANGQSLPAPLQQKLERHLGADLGEVKVHAGAESATAADAVGARAYTVGRDIHFGAGEYDPSSKAGQELLAHEVVHTVQQSKAGPSMQCKKEGEGDSDSDEKEADDKAQGFVGGSKEGDAKAKGGDEKAKGGDEKAKGGDEKVTGGGGGAGGRVKLGDHSVMYPLGDPMLDGQIQMLMGMDQSITTMLPQMFDGIKEFGGAQLQELPEGANQQIEQGMDPDLSHNAQEMDLSENDLKQISLTVRMSQQALMQARGDVKEAQAELQHAKDSKRARELRRKATEAEEGMDNALEIVEGVAHLAISFAEVEENPIGFFESMFDMGKALGALDDTMSAEDNDATLAEDDADDSGIGAAELKYENAAGEVKEATGLSSDAVSLAEEFQAKFEKRRKKSEAKFDKQTKGDFKFGPMAEQIEKLEKLAEDCKQLQNAILIATNLIPAMQGNIQHVSSQVDRWCHWKRDSRTYVEMGDGSIAEGPTAQEPEHAAEWAMEKVDQANLNNLAVPLRDVNPLNAQIDDLGKYGAQVGMQQRQADALQEAMQSTLKHLRANREKADEMMVDAPEQPETEGKGQKGKQQGKGGK